MDFFSGSAAFSCYTFFIRSRQAWRYLAKAAGSVLSFLNTLFLLLHVFSGSMIQNLDCIRASFHQRFIKSYD